MSTQCPEMGRSARYAYDRLSCRCEVCTAENTAKSERQRRRRGDRIQLRKSGRAVLCPTVGKPTPTAYREGCRCDVCLPRAGRTKVRTGALLTIAEQDNLFKEFVQALRADVGLLVELAEVARESVEKQQSKEG